MESPHLFSHSYDIDTIILALCGTTPQWLETATGTLSNEEPAHIPASKRFLIVPLPTSFLNELKTDAAEDTQSTEILNLIPQSTSQLPAHFSHGRPGAWLRERVKDAALEWLDMHNLIPPSMRHTSRKSTQKLARSIVITAPEN